MLKKEFNEILKQSLYLIIFLICLPLLFMAGSRILGTSVSYLQFFFMLFQVGLLIFALIAGISLFTSERKQGGIEYLLTLPISRLKLLTIKICPRLAALTAFSLLYVLLVNILTNGAESMQLTYALPANIFFFMLCSLFIISVSLSASHSNFLVIALLGLVIFSIYGMLVYYFTRTGWLELFIGPIDESAAGVIFNFLLILPLPLLFSFIFSFRKFDVGPGKSFNKSYLKLFIPFVIAGVLLSFSYLYMIKLPPYKDYYLTKEHKLIEMRSGSTRVYDGEKVTEIDALGFVTQEYGDSLYLRSYKTGREILRIDKKNGLVDLFYTMQGWIRLPVGKYKDTMVFTEPNRAGEQYLVLINMDSKAVKKIKLPGTEEGDYFGNTVFGADEEEGQRFWLVIKGKIHDYTVYRIWDDGRSEKLALTWTRPVYVSHRLLTTDKKGIVVNKLTAEGIEVIKELPVRTDITFITSYFQRNLDTGAVKEIYGRIPGTTTKVLWIDMEALATGWVQDEGIKSVTNFYPDLNYAVDWDYDNQGRIIFVNSISRLRKGKTELLKTFEPNKYQWIFPDGCGFFLKVAGKVKVYAVPDLKELTFKGLN